MAARSRRNERGTPGAGEDVSRPRSRLGTEYLAGIFRTPDDPASQVAAAVSAQGLTQGTWSTACSPKRPSPVPNMDMFAPGVHPVRDSTLLRIKQMIQGSGAVRALVLQIDDASVGGQLAYSSL
jgi:hypothetical protein